MAVDEAPRLTRRVVFLVTCAVFLLCLFADSLKCRPGGLHSLCIGPQYRWPCRKKGQLNCPVEERWTHGLDGGAARGNVDHVLYILEVMPSDPDDRQAASKRNVSDFLEGALQRSLRGKGALPYRLGASPIVEMLHTWMHTNHSKMLLRDTLAFPYPNLTLVAIHNRMGRFFHDVTPAEESWLSELRNHLPSPQTVLGDSQALRRYFPGLSTGLETVYKQKRFVGALNRDRVRLSVLVVINPGVHLESWVPLASETESVVQKRLLDPRSVAQHVVDQATTNVEVAFNEVVAAVDNLLTFRYQYMRLIADKVYACIPLGFPAVSFGRTTNAKGPRATLDEVVFDTLASPVPPREEGKSSRPSLSNQTPEQFFSSLPNNASAVVAATRVAQEAIAPEDASIWAPATAKSSAAAKRAWLQYTRQSPYIAALEQAFADRYRSHRTLEGCDGVSLFRCLWPRDTSATRILPLDVFLENCFFYVAAHSGASFSSPAGTWRPENQSTHFSDALHLTDAGMERLADCAVAIALWR